MLLKLGYVTYILHAFLFTAKYVIFVSSGVVSPSNITLYITSLVWVVSLTLGVVLITLILSPSTGYASSPHGASIDASCVT